MRRLIIVLLALPFFACGDTSTSADGDTATAEQDTADDAAIADDTATVADTAAADTTPTAWVTLSGTAYAFAAQDPVEGAVVRIDELPELTATSDANGYWELDVPEGATVTPWVSHPDYLDMYAQTYADVDAPIGDIYFQMVTPFIYQALSAILEVTPDPEKCQVSSTVSEKAVQGVTFAQFIAHGAHGVAGATVTIDPPVAEVVYFNKNVAPDRSLTETSRDGGVVWTNLDPGVYVLRATHPDTAFAEVTVTCTAGRFVNPSPPQGLAEL
ncbi:MAG: hypothetical protein EP329_05950 [Deltaproteobacteria bacterium]|nr:MAG: hypothetical protein EP329_05950 [Deltaproteobacteria bacterium]